MVTEPGSPLQVKCQDGMRFHPSPSWGHTAAALSEDGLSGLEKWSHTPAVVPQYSLTYPSGRGRGQRRWNLPLLPADLRARATCTGSSLKRGVGLGQKLRFCPRDRWSGGRASDMCRSVLKNCTLYFMSFNPSCSVVSDSLRPHGHQAPPSMGFSRQEYWSGCHFLLQETSRPRDWTQVSHIVDRRFTVWATREVKGRLKTNWFSLSRWLLSSALCVMTPFLL